MGLTCRPFPSPKQPFSPLKVSAGQIPPSWTLLMRQESILMCTQFRISTPPPSAEGKGSYALVPDTRGRPTPAWDTATHLQFMANHSISYAFLSISTPASNVFLGNQTLSVGLARLLNEWLAELVQTFPERFSFFAVAPLPYVSASITEVNYALEELHTRGIGLLTNHEGLYLGHPDLRAFFASLNSASYRSPSIFVHPTAAFLRINGSVFEANPTLYPMGLVEYYFDTARTMLDLTLTQSFVNFTNIRWIFSHCGGAFPSIEDRALKLQPAIEVPAEAVYRSRVWYDSAGPTYFAQVKGLLGYGVPTSQLVFGSDYPYASGTYELGIGAIQEADFLAHQEKEAIFSSNYKAVLGEVL
ncbi:hypothetical protein FJTKL_07817 [Diaporthe vaccinii]|uniref:Amidohydrolase-related domain-containing protein n=1 Tax=Diaporthe vaccinii TaxID=105482 RepID=A0ABR4FDI5_9PEZI